MIVLRLWGRGGRGLALLGTVALVAPAAAQQSASVTSSAAMPHPLNLQPPIPDPQPAAANGQPLVRGSPATPDCAPAWPCRLRLFGEIEKYGGIGLKATALTW